MSGNRPAYQERHNGADRLLPLATVREDSDRALTQPRGHHEEHIGWLRAGLQPR